MSQPITSNRILYFLSLLKQSIRGDQQDYTTGSIRKAVFMLAIPMILEMGMESVFAIVDLYFVGHLPNSSHAIQTVGLTESVLTLIYSVAIGISMAATATVARRSRISGRCAISNCSVDGNSYSERYRVHFCRGYSSAYGRTSGNH
jgi:uncharacterized Fe-S cluster-containing radical SAM superfamily enzyme